MIPATQARALFTEALVDTYKEMPISTSFLRSFFPTALNNSRYVSIEVQRGFEKIATDIIRGADGNRNSAGRSTSKVFDPPYFNEYFDLTELDAYDRAFGSTGINESAIADLAVEAADNTRMLRDKIERAYELMCAQAFLTGVITLKNGDNVDFKRKAGSLVNTSGSNPWVTGSNDPRKDLAAAALFIRQNGKSQGGVFNVIMGSTALTQFLSNTTIQNAGDVLRIDSMSIRQPQRDSLGATSHGSISAGDYRFNIWSYPEYYDNAAGVSTPYLDPKKVIVLPEAPRFKMAFAGVPRLIGGNMQMTPNDFFVHNIMDESKATDQIHVKSAGIPIITAVDQIFTAQVVA